METTARYQVNESAVSREGSAVPTARLLQEIDHLRLEAGRRMARDRQSEMGQFFTPSHVALLMASFLEADSSEIRLLDAGAGIGSLFAACVSALTQRQKRPQSLHVTAYEIEPQFQVYLESVGELCSQECARVGIAFTLEIRPKDFIQDATESLCHDLFAQPLLPFTCAILNPPYRKIHSASASRQRLRQAGIETGNLYTGFLALAMRLLCEGGELIAITPRSFCNGSYFRPFRKSLLQTMELRHIHLFESREEAFREDAVLQETIILHAVKSSVRPERVVVTTSAGAEDDAIMRSEHPYARIVHPDDPEQFIRVVSDGLERRIGEQMAQFQATLSDLGLSVSTGRVVDFRATAFLRPLPEAGAAPLLYPAHLENSGVRWPVQTKKPQALTLCKETDSLLIPNETYVLVKRFSAKEEPRRLVASVYEGGQLPGNRIGIENHLNYFHNNGRGIDLPLARGLALYLNSTLADRFFRQFSGHTQVNATDLRNMNYPTAEQLRQLSHKAATYPLDQDAIDSLIRQEFFAMADATGAARLPA